MEDALMSEADGRKVLIPVLQPLAGPPGAMQVGAQKAVRRCPRCGARAFRAWDADYISCINCGDQFVGVPLREEPGQKGRASPAGVPDAVGRRPKAWRPQNRSLKACASCGAPITPRAKLCQSCARAAAAEAMRRAMAAARRAKP
jgi:ribosomal protein S27AE